MRSVVVTGATSMLGVSFINECVAQGTKVLALARENSKNLSRLSPSNLVEIVECDLSKMSELSTKMAANQNFDCFYHFGWQGTDKTERYDPQTQLENVQFTLDALNLAKYLGCKKFVGAGSQAEFGRATEKLSPNTPVNPESAYGVAKYSAYKLSKILARKLKIEHVWVRVLSVYGPFDSPDTMIMTGIRQLVEKNRPQYTKGQQLWDYLFSGDAGKAFYLIGEKGKDEALYCLGSGIARPLSDYVKIMRDAVDPRLEVGLGEIEYPANQVMYLCADIENLTKDTGFVPETDFETGIKKTIRWYEEELSK